MDESINNIKTEFHKLECDNEVLFIKFFEGYKNYYQLIDRFDVTTECKIKVMKKIIKVINKFNILTQLIKIQNGDGDNVYRNISDCKIYLKKILSLTKDNDKIYNATIKIKGLVFTLCSLHEEFRQCKESDDILNVSFNNIKIINRFLITINVCLNVFDSVFFT